MKTEAQKLAAHHLYLASSINTYILPLLVSYLQDTEVQKKSHFTQGESLISEYKRSREAVELVRILFRDYSLI